MRHKEELNLEQTSAANYAGREYNVKKNTTLLAFTSMLVFLLPVLLYSPLWYKVERHNSDMVLFLGISSAKQLEEFVFPPYSESFGRKALYLTSMSLFVVISIPIGMAHSMAAVFVGRFLLSASPSIVVAGTLEDMFGADTRLWLVSVWLVVANLSLVVGPIFASYVASSIGWSKGLMNSDGFYLADNICSRWIVHISASVAAVAFWFLVATCEIRATCLLQQYMSRLLKRTP